MGWNIAYWQKYICSKIIFNSYFQFFFILSFMIDTNSFTWYLENCPSYYFDKTFRTL